MNELLPLLFVPTTSTLLKGQSQAFLFLKLCRAYSLEWRRVFPPAHSPRAVHVTRLRSGSGVIVAASVCHASSSLGRFVSIDCDIGSGRRAD